MAQLVKNPPAMQETWVRPLGWEDPLEKGKATYSSILENCMDCIVHGVTGGIKNSLFFFFFLPVQVIEKTVLVVWLEKQMATHFSWRVPGTEEPGGLLSMGSHRVRHD